MSRARISRTAGAVTAAIAILIAGLFAGIALPARAQLTGEPPAELRFEVTRFVVEGENPLAPAETDAVLAPYLGAHEGIAGLLSAAGALEQALGQKLLSFHRVVLPPQTLEGGTVRLAVVAFKLGKVDVRGNEHFSADNIVRSIPALRLGQSPDTRAVARQRLHANQHPAKRVEVKFKQSESEAETVDAVLDVSDSRPWSLFASINNTGSADTGETRLTVGAQLANLFDRDHQLTVSYTRSPEEWAKVEQIGVNYVAPLYGVGGTVSAFFVDSDVNTGQVEQFFDVSGAGRFWGVSYRQNLRRKGAYTHGISIGVDDKHFKNNVSFLGVPIGSNVRSRPLTVGYDAAYEFAAGKGSAAFRAAFVRNLPGGSDGDAAAYRATRAGADRNWQLVRLGGNLDRAFASGWLARVRIDSQWTNEPLISGEQFGLGGAQSVRGYEEREVSGDHGIFGSAEVWTPALFENLRAVGFLDAGGATVESPQAGERRHRSILGAGVGVRWFWQSNLSVEIDAARALREGTATHRGDYSVHLGVFYRY